MVRKATIQDLDNVFELVKDFTVSFKPQKELFIQSFENLLSDKKAFVFVADNDNKIVGYLLGFIHNTFFANGNVAWIEEIMADNKFRRSGIGSELINAFEQKAKDNDCKLISLAKVLQRFRIPLSPPDRYLQRNGSIMRIWFKYVL